MNERLTADQLAPISLVLAILR